MEYKASRMKAPGLWAVLSGTPYMQPSALWNSFSLEDSNEQRVEQNG
ncbi:hypothetical protein GCM10022296_01700 [Secundilactobacillus similis DSM 23365 = JCM 2765]